MAGPLALIPSEETSEKLAGAGENQWQVQYSRFFNYPTVAFASAELVPLPPKFRNRRPSGTWIASSSRALLQLLPHGSNPDVILVVCLGENFVLVSIFLPALLTP